MEAVVAIVALLLVSRSNQQQQPNSGTDTSKALGGGLGALGATAASALGGIGSGAGGAAAAGGAALTAELTTTGLEATADASIAATTSELGAGYAAANAADAIAVADAAASTTVLGSAVAGGFMFIAVLAFVALGLVINFTNAHNEWWIALTTKKHERYFSDWWQHEEQAIAAWLGDLGIVAAAALDQNGKPFFDPPVELLNQVIEGEPVLDAGISSSFYSSAPPTYLGQIFDKRVSRQQLVDLRILTRWFAITRSRYENLALKDFFTTSGQPAPYDSTKNGGYVPAGAPVTGGFGEQTHPNGNLMVSTSGYSGNSFMPGNGTEATPLVPGMSDAALLELAENYCKLQPFARSGQVPAEHDGRTLSGFPRPAGSMIAPASSTAKQLEAVLAARSSSISTPAPTQSFADSMAVPGFLPQYTTFASVRARAASVLASIPPDEHGHKTSIAEQESIARVVGHANALNFIVASIVYQNAIWPGDDAVTLQMRKEAKLSGYSVQHVVIDPTSKGPTAGQAICVLRDEATGFAIDVISGRSGRGPFVYPASAIASVQALIAGVS